VIARFDGAPHTEQVYSSARESEQGHDALAPYQLNWARFWESDFDQSEWLLEPLIAKGRTHAIVAPAKAGKSLLTLEACAALATGRAFLNHPAGEPATVVYVDYEMTEADVHDRMVEFGYGPEDDLSRLVYILLPQIRPLDTSEGGASFVAEVLALDASLVVIDTLSRAVSGEENASETARELYRCTLLPLKSAGVATLRLDHMGKDTGKGARGSSAKVADVDIEWLMSARGDAVTLKAENTRMSWVPKEVKLSRAGGTPVHSYAPGRRADTWDAVQWLGKPTQAGQWVTAESAALDMAAGQDVDSHDRRRARDHLNRLVKQGVVERNDGQRGGSGGSGSNVYRLRSEQ
jgi:hypothetical protein